MLVQTVSPEVKFRVNAMDFSQVNWLLAGIMLAATMAIILIDSLISKHMSWRAIVLAPLGALAMLVSELAKTQLAEPPPATRAAAPVYSHVTSTAPTHDPLDTELEQIVQIGSCELASKFIAEHPGSRQAEFANAWVVKSCRRTREDASRTQAAPSRKDEAPPRVEGKPSKVAATPAAAPAAKPNMKPSRTEAALPEDAVPHPAPKPAADTRIVSLQIELKRVNCFQGLADGQASNELTKAVNSYNAFARDRISFSDVDAMLRAVKGADGVVCP